MVRARERRQDETKTIYGVSFVVDNEYGERVGGCFLDLTKDIPWIVDVRVDEREQGKGYGKELMQGVVKYARDNRMPLIGLDTSKENKRAQHIYCLVGFEIDSPDRYKWTVNMLCRLEQ